VAKLLFTTAIFLLAGTLAAPSAFCQTPGPSAGAPAGAQAPHFLPGHVTTTTARTGVEETGKPAAKVHKSYASVGFLSTTTSSLEGYSILEYRGLVEGAAVRVPTWDEDAAAGVQEVAGGKIESYTHMCEEARIEAFASMVERAKEIGANAIIGIHFDSQVMPLDKGKFASGVVCVGTAVTVQRK
jgi:uncharacterized protein YbjQ (UPF0145 family)